MAQPLDVLLAGATGLVGRATLTRLLDDPAVGRVTTVVRRSTGVTHAKLDERIVDFDHLSIGGRADVAICCLGTTIKQAGSQERFRQVDHDYVVAFARAAHFMGARHFLVVTAVGADATSLTFYNRVKGEVEAALRAIGFPALTIARPSLLLGERKEMRLGERLAAPFSKLLPARFRGIEGDTVARALVRLATSPASGERIVPSQELATLGA